MSATRDCTAVYPVPHKISSDSISEYLLKRPFDFVLASFAFAVSLPLWMIIAIAIKLEDGGPIFYRQKRWGKNKTLIDFYKFRSMVADADQKFGPLQAKQDDPRITRIGRFLRATSLDEIPQILNIWKGEMSWVGPRAYPIDVIHIREQKENSAYLSDEAIPGFGLRCQVRPGLTGLAQVYAPRDVPRRHKFRYDLIYIQNQSLWLDLKLIALSFWITFRARWESREKKF